MNRFKLFTFSVLFSVLFIQASRGQELNIAVLKTKINSHPNHNPNLSKGVLYYLDTCTIKNNFTKEEFLQFVASTDVNETFRLLDADMESIFTSKSKGFQLSYTPIDWYDSIDKHDLFLIERVNKYLLFTKNRKEKESNKPFKFQFGYFIFEKDKTIYCLLRVVEI